MKIKINTVKCNRCGKEWIPRKPDVRVCPKCHSALWDIPKNSTEPKEKTNEKIL